MFLLYGQKYLSIMDMVFEVYLPAVVHNRTARGLCAGHLKPVTLNLYILPCKMKHWVHTFAPIGQYMV